MSPRTPPTTIVVNQYGRIVSGRPRDHIIAAQLAGVTEALIPAEALGEADTLVEIGQPTTLGRVTTIPVNVVFKENG